MLFDRNSKEGRSLEISAGLVVGYLIAGFINAAINDKPWEEAFFDSRILTGVAGIALTIAIFYWNKRRLAQQEEEEA